jgi:hypothetical protein
MPENGGCLSSSDFTAFLHPLQNILKIQMIIMAVKKKKKKKKKKKPETRKIYMLEKFNFNSNGAGSENDISVKDTVHGRRGSSP